MSFFTRFPFLCFLTILVLGTTWPLSVTHAALAPETAPPAKKIKQRKQKKQQYRNVFRLKKRRLIHQPPLEKQSNNIIFGLYVTFGILILLPVLVLGGSLLVGFGFPSLLFYSIGVSLIGIGNLGILLAGSLTGKTATYNTQVLFFSVWVLFGINAIAALSFLLLGLFLFAGAPMLLFLGIGLGILALVFLIWGALISRKKRQFKKSSQLDAPQ